MNDAEYQDAQRIGQIMEHQRIVHVLNKIYAAHDGIATHAEGVERIAARGKADVIKTTIEHIGGVASTDVPRPLPIEKAPKSTRLLLWDSITDEWVFGSSEDGEEWLGDRHAVCDTIDGQDVLHPTFYMPEPIAPTDEQ